MRKVKFEIDVVRNGYIVKVLRVFAGPSDELETAHFVFAVGDEDKMFAELKEISEWCRKAV